MFAEMRQAAAVVLEEGGIQSKAQCGLYSLRGGIDERFSVRKTPRGYPRAVSAYMAAGGFDESRRDGVGAVRHAQPPLEC